MAKSDNLKKAIGAIDAKILRLEHERRKLTQQLDDLLAKPSNEGKVNARGWQPSSKPVTVVDSALAAVIAEANSNEITITLYERDALLALLTEMCSDDGGLTERRIGLWSVWISKWPPEELAAIINHVWGGDTDWGTDVVAWLQQCLPTLFTPSCEPGFSGQYLANRRTDRIAQPLAMGVSCDRVVKCHSGKDLSARIGGLK